jgi:hypothetical protein
MCTIRSFLLLVSIISLPACAPAIWDKPGTTPVEFSLDIEQCGRIADDANREPNVRPIATGDLKQKVATNASPDLLEGIVRRMAVSHTHDRCMESKGYVASASGAPRGSRIRTYRPVETANVVATADIEYYRGNSAADLLRFRRSDPKLVTNRDRLYNSYALADATDKLSIAAADRQTCLIRPKIAAPMSQCGSQDLETASTGVDLFADVGAKWRKLFFDH